MESRTPAPDDTTLFAPAAVVCLRVALGEIVWLLDRGYALPSVLELVGNRHRLDARQRKALQRASCSTAERDARLAKRVAWEAARDHVVEIDGFNLIVTLESAVGGAPVFLGNDDAPRDLAGLRGSYRLTGDTARCIDLVGEAVALASPARVRVWLDGPVSNSGRLRALWTERAALWTCPVDIELVDDPDRVLAGRDLVVSSDARVIDHASRTTDLTSHVIARSIPEAWVIGLRGGA